MQVITEAIMSLPYEESDRVFPELYLPIMEECHVRVLQRWRAYLPILPSWWAHRSRNRKLDKFVIDLLRARWQQIEDRCASCCPGQPWQHSSAEPAVNLQARHGMHSCCLSIEAPKASTSRYRRSCSRMCPRSRDYGQPFVRHPHNRFAHMLQPCHLSRVRNVLHRTPWSVACADPRTRCHALVSSACAAWMHA